MRNKTPQEIEAMARQIIRYIILQVPEFARPDSVRMLDWYTSDKEQVHQMIVQIAETFPHEK